MKNRLYKLADSFGYQISIKDKNYPKEFEKIFWKNKPYTMSTKERAFALYNSVKYIVKSKIEGDFVECGVWKGGSINIMTETLMTKNITNKTIWLYDTFRGATRPSIHDFKNGKSVLPKWFKSQNYTHNYNEWGYCSLKDMTDNLRKTKYPKKLYEMIMGDVHNTIPYHIPKKIALLRLDTDWYSSTKHELEHLFPKIVKGGVIIVDDYGEFAGSKKATNEYFAKNKIQILLNKIDYTGVIGIKQ